MLGMGAVKLYSIIGEGSVYNVHSYGELLIRVGESSKKEMWEELYSNCVGRGIRLFPFHPLLFKWSCPL